MDRFVVLSTVTEQVIADRCCAELEDKNIPVMLEHVVIRSRDNTDSSHASGYRLMVPSDFVQTARLVVDQTLSNTNPLLSLKRSVESIIDHNTQGELQDAISAAQEQYEAFEKQGRHKAFG